MHKSVLLHQSIDGLNIQAGNRVVDATLNGGGHSEEIARRFGSTVEIIGIDLDQDALDRAEPRLNEAGAKIHLRQGNFKDMDKMLAHLQIQKVNAILFDLGWSTNQFEQSGRGFSFQRDEALLMTFKKNPEEAEITAYDIVNDWDENNIADVIYAYGEERYSKRIAWAIVQARQDEPIETTFQLIRLIEEAVPSSYKRQKIHFATRTFQGLRIAVNDEIRSLEQGLKVAFDCLEIGGRIAVISFHSIEDRVVKRFFKELKDKKCGNIVFKKPITPSLDEVKENRRSRSAKLRVIEKIHEYTSI